MSERDVELVAALAAVDAYVRAEAAERVQDAAPPASAQAAWRERARLANCGITVPWGSRAGWSVAERLRRGAGGFYGITGL